MTGNTSNLFGVRIEQLLAEEDDTSYNLTVLDKPNVSGSDWSNQVSISMISEENYSISLYIKGTTEMILGKKYKYADMDEWSNINNNNTYQNSPLSDAAITWSQRDGYDRYEGFVSDTLGNTYKFLYQDGPIIPTDDTISVSFSRVGSFEYSRWDSCWKVSGYDNYGSSNPYSVYFALNIDNESCPAGHFTEADFAEPEYNHIYINKQGKPSKDYKMLTADIDITVSSDTIILKGYAYLEDGNVYDIEIFYSDPKPVYKKTLEIYNLAVDTSGIQWGGVNTQASNDEYELRISFWIPDDSTDYHGTYDYGQMYPSIYDKTDSTYIQLFSGSITITKGADGDEITGALLGWNNTEYTVDLRTKVPASVGIISTAPKKKAVKRFVNGKIIIEIEGKAYSLTGAEIE